MRVTALVSGEADKARAVAAQHGVPENNLYDYRTFDRLRDNPDVDVVYIVRLPARGVAARPRGWPPPRP